MKVIFISICLLVLGVLVFPVFASAQDGFIPCGNAGQPDCNFCHVFVLGHNIIAFLLIPSLSNVVPIVLMLASLLFAWAGFLFLTAAGNASRLEQAKTVIKATIVGIIIIYGSWLFIGLILGSLGVADFAGAGDGWWKITCNFQ
jgi:hypothetical protein